MAVSGKNWILTLQRHQKLYGSKQSLATRLWKIQEKSKRNIHFRIIQEQTHEDSI